ncbi:MAG: hypothetical protein VB084_08615 [Syntrophomonadaceae bacterium]|nr:hypothetical protein [Syntrophomonadaceae bacterium]
MKHMKIVFFILGVYFIFKACSLYGTYFSFNDGDGDGIGIYLLGFEINDKVPIGNVPVYATAITVLGIILILPMITRIFPKTNQSE